MVEHRSGPVRSAAAREAILGATARLFAKDGWDHLTMEGIAKEAGVAKQTVYRWWPSRGALIADCMIEGRLVDIELEIADTGDLRRDLETWLTPLLNLATTERGATLVRSLIAAGAEDAAVGERMSRALGVDKKLSDRFVSAMRAGQLPEDTPVEEIGDVILGAMVLPIIGRRQNVSAGVQRIVDYLITRRH